MHFPEQIYAITHQYTFTLANGTLYHISETRVQDFSGCESMQLH